MAKKKTEEEFAPEEEMEVEGTVVEETADEVAYEVPSAKAKYRYFCDACTNIAFFSNKIEEGLHGTCVVCGKPYVTRKENFIKL